MDEQSRKKYMEVIRRSLGQEPGPAPLPCGQLPGRFAEREFPPASFTPADAGACPRYPLENVRAVVFDVYGTLLVSAAGDIGTDGDIPLSSRLDAVAAQFTRDGSGKVLKEYFREAVGKEHRRLSPKVRFPEVRVEELWARLPSLNSGADPMELAIAYELAVNPVAPMPYALEVISTLDREGVVLGIVSNAQAFTPLLFDVFFGSSLERLGFEPDLCSYSYSIRTAKPDAALFHQVVRGLERRGITASSVLYCGNDMLNDIAPAQETGFRTGLFAGDRRSLRLREDNPACDGILPDVVIRSLDSIIPLVGLA